VDAVAPHLLAPIGIAAPPRIVVATPIDDNECRVTEKDEVTDTKSARGRIRIISHLPSAGNALPARSKGTATARGNTSATTAYQQRRWRTKGSPHRGHGQAPKRWAVYASAAPHTTAMALSTK